MLATEQKREKKKKVERFGIQILVGSSYLKAFIDCFHVLAIINSAVMNIGLHVSLSILVSSMCMPSSGIAGS